MTPTEFEQWLRTASPAQRRPLVMGILNVTPDSFSDGGRWMDAAAADQAARMADEGADLIDVGGESTRPGSAPVPAEEQIRRVTPVIREIARRCPGVVISVDTTQSAVAAAALDAGAAVLNDVSAGTDDPAYLPLAARAGVPVVLMHMQGRPATMQINPTYGNVAAEVRQFLNERAAAAVQAGIPPHRIVVDPGIGFGKTLGHNLSLMRDVRQFAADGRPVLVGTSRKGFIGAVTGVADAAARIHGTSATIAWAVANGAGIVRVHDVGPMVQVVRMTQAIVHAADRPTG
jgi:dihydropteroate synthase